MDLTRIITVVILSSVVAFALEIVVSSELQAQWLTPREEDENFTCPEIDEISPCFCDSRLTNMPTVFCYGIDTLKAIRRALEDRFMDRPIPFLKMHRCSFVGLPAGAFTNISASRLQISDVHLDYVNPDAFSGMDSLLLLILRNVLLYEVPGHSFLHLSSLVTLSLNDNKLSKLARDDLRYASGIKHFSAANNRVAHIERGTFPQGLIYLSLTNNHLYSLNKTVRHLPFLEWLLLSENRLTNMNGDLAGLFSLKILTLGKNLLMYLGGSLHSLHKLEILDLQYNVIFELEDSFRHLYRLQWLNLSNNMLRSLDHCSFRDLISLETLDLSGNFLQALNGNLDLLTGLVSLNLAQNWLSEFSTDDIKELRYLRTLNLLGNNLSSLDNSLDDAHKLPLRVLFLQGNLVTNIHGFLRNFPMLEDLDLSYNEIYRLWSYDFLNCSRLAYVNIEGNPLICDLHQVHVFHELENRKVEIAGMPQCSVIPNLL